MTLKWAKTLDEIAEQKKLKSRQSAHKRVQLWSIVKLDWYYDTKELMHYLIDKR